MASEGRRILSPVRLPVPSPRRVSDCVKRFYHGTYISSSKDTHRINRIDRDAQVVMLVDSPVDLEPSLATGMRSLTPRSCS